MSLQCRTTIVAALYVNTVSSSGTLQLGDGDRTDMKTKALAVQKAIPNFIKDEFRYASYPLFFLPKLTLKQPCVSVNMTSVSPWPTIQVGPVYMLGISSSSIMRVGCGGPLQGSSRIKHIRDFNNLTSAENN
ncbi:spore germination protein GerPE [Cohnella terricola]|uniref:Spore germination protein GerPE n=1 Tax=Cohnella terricola TaxID=1289167 RepID=A0A559JX91_9BACL|nr:spore germination protein GerPE [Cohnella terricola]TVY04420.1 spore germination protein GerPE [Cohnella terricola]